MDGRRLVLAAALAGPPLVFAVAQAQGTPSVLVLAGLAGTTAALLVVHGGLRRAGFAPVAAATCLLVLYGTSLVWHAVQAGPAPAVFLAGAAATDAWWRRMGRWPAGSLAWGALLGLALAAIALAAEAAEGGLAGVSMGAPALLESLLSSRHGVLFWAPVLSVALLGLALLAARGRSEARASLLALAVVALAHASLRPWWAGEVANARVLPVLPLLAPGLAAVLDEVRAAARRRPLRVLGAAGGLLVLWNLLFMAQYRGGLIPRDETLSFPDVAENSARLLADTVGSPTAWPANWLFSLRHGLPAARFDLLGGQDVLAAGGATLDVGDLADDAAVLIDGWSVRHPCAEAVCREVEGRARAVLPMVDPGPARVHVRARGSGTLRASLGGAAGTARLGDVFGEVVFAAGPGLRRGPNLLVLEVSPGGQALVDAIRVVPLPRHP